MKRQRPGNARSVRDGLKLHRHEVRSVRGARTVITLRPGTHARFSTNRFHETWHVLSDDHGARLLARLLWGLLYQARPGTVVLIDREFLAPTPFDADPADPIVLVPGWCTRFDDRSAAGLKQILPLGDSCGTVRWQTFGLDRMQDPEARGEWWDRRHHRTVRGHIERRRGLLVLTPNTPEDARAWALQASALDSTRYGTDHAYLDQWDHGHDGEIQIFRRFRPMVSVARQARTQVLARENRPGDPDGLRAAVWSQAEIVRGDAHLRIREWSVRGYEIGRAAAPMLAAADVHSLDELEAVGAAETYRRLRAAEVKGLTLEMLWALEGALTYRDRRMISAERRRELIAEIGEAPAPATPLPRRRLRSPVRSPHAVMSSAQRR
ncbi:TfoX/Sxy family DNA transformation protein [Nocardia sp. NPDC058176]|uniref:TfoX/Sxy family DNA transformation protein n=1 Tax=Nocardia sp. NPDC058176 TaxID=3346368 RepID=UPI0036D78202